MNLRTVAENDLAFILEDDIRGGAWPITLINPVGLSAPLKGFSNDISQLIDPDTGQSVSGRLATVSLRISSIIAAGFTSFPENVPDKDSKPWVVIFDDINGSTYTFKVSESNPDRAIGIITCMLEKYINIDFLEWTPGDFMEWTPGDVLQLVS